MKARKPFNKPGSQGHHGQRLPYDLRSTRDDFRKLGGEISEGLGYRGFGEVGLWGLGFGVWGIWITGFGVWVLGLRVCHTSGLVGCTFRPRI